jgi:hypothetical protein
VASDSDFVAGIAIGGVKQRTLLQWAQRARRDAAPGSVRVRSETKLAHEERSLDSLNIFIGALT